MNPTSPSPARALIDCITQFERAYASDHRFADIIGSLREVADEVKQLAPGADAPAGESPGRRAAREASQGAGTPGTMPGALQALMGASQHQ